MFYSVLYITSHLKQMTRQVAVYLDEDGVMIPGKASIRYPVDIIRHN